MTKQICQIDGCRNETNSSDGVCAVCDYKIRQGVMDKVLKKEGEGSKTMGNSTVSVKTCIDCHNSFTPGSNRQERCPECKEAHKKAKAKGYQTTYRSKNKHPEKPPQKTKTRPAEIKKLPGNGNYTITVDFSPYPNLHERLLEIAKEQIRRPEDQLLFMLKEELASKEQAASV